MPCKQTFQLSKSTFPKQLSIVFYRNGYGKHPGRQVHISCHSPYIPKIAIDQIKFFQKSEWDHFMRFLRAVKDCPNQVELNKIPLKEPIQYTTTEHPRTTQNPPTGLQIPFDQHFNYRNVLITFPVIDEILDLEREIKTLFDVGLQNEDCNCIEWTDKNFIGECIMQNKQLDDPSIMCPECTFLTSCCKKNHNIHPYYGWNWPDNLEPMILRSGRRIARVTTPSPFNFLF